MSSDHPPVLPLYRCPTDCSSSVPLSSVAPQTLPNTGGIDGRGNNQPPEHDTSSQLDGTQSPAAPIPGYPALADWMSKIPETAIFRRFGALNILNLLYYQAELTDFELDLRKRQQAANQSDGSQRAFATNWWFLGNSESDPEQWDFFKEKIRPTLKEYNDALIQQQRILRIAPPASPDLKALQSFMDTDSMGPLSLNGDDSHIWGASKQATAIAKQTGQPVPPLPAPDLVGLLARHKEDIFSKWVTEKATARLGTFKYFQSRKFYQMTNIKGCRDDLLLKWTFSITSILASALPILSICILYIVRSPKLRLVLIGVFNLLLSICLTAFTNAKGKDVFAIAAAFSAVQVVFIQGDLGNRAY